MKRGEIYLIKRRDTIGSEISKARPAVIVSSEYLNATSEVVEVVYLTTQPKRDMPTHVCINSTGVPSQVLCEQIDSISTRLAHAKVGECTAEEMKAIDHALLNSLGIKQEPVRAIVTVDEVELAKVTAERDAYKALVDQMLRQGVCGA
jgi:mRNA interferase MazF